MGGKKSLSFPKKCRRNTGGKAETPITAPEGSEAEGNGSKIKGSASFIGPKERATSRKKKGADNTY